MPVQPENQVPHELRDKVDRELESGEQVQWLQMPVPRYFTPAATAGFLFGIPAVFADARQISFDVARVMICLIERRGKYQIQPFRTPHEMLVDRGHGTRSASRFRGATDNSPGLNNGVNAALLV